MGGPLTTLRTLRQTHRAWAPACTRLLPLLLLVMLMAVVAGCASASGRPSSLATAGATAAGAQPTAASGGAGAMLHVQGARIVDAAGREVVLRGAMIPTSLAYINRYAKGQDPTQILNAATFTAMASWHMNAVRINISYWIYQVNPTLYLSQLDRAVAAAHAAGLYVILDYHDDKQSGDQSADGVMHATTVTFWQIIASHYKSDSMMLFDPMNEPKYSDWQTWLNGDGAGIVGYQQIIAAIRGVGANQIIVLEPGHGCNCGSSIWQGVDRYLPGDPNVIFSQHDYAEVVSGNPQAWDAAWGPILGRYPIYYGEWAVLPHANYPIFCRGLTSDNADTVTNTFLAYLQARHANWTAWDFNPSNLVQSFTGYEPTTFQSGAPWSCEDSSAAQAGMGLDIKQFLAAHPG